MLVLSRKLMERIIIGDNICLTVVRLEGGQVRLGIEAPREISVVRAELLQEGGRSLPEEPSSGTDRLGTSPEQVAMPVGAGKRTVGDNQQKYPDATESPARGSTAPSRTIISPSTPLHGRAAARRS